MLGNFSRGMTVKVPARFQDNNQKSVSVENVVVRIEHFDNTANSVMIDIPETPMPKINDSDYLYEYTIPTNKANGSYFVYITAKIPTNKNRVFEAVEQFVLVDDINKEVKELTPESSIPPPTMTYASPNITPQSGIVSVEDVVVDVENKPLKGVHINAYLKANFMPNDNNNVKVGGTMTDDNGRWKLTIPHGEYVIVYKAIGMKENRELRKV